VVLSSCPACWTSDSHNRWTTIRGRVITTTSTDYNPGEHTLTRGEIGMRYVFVGIRIHVDPNDPDDVAEVHAVQDAILVEQPIRLAWRRCYGRVMR
jgi:hypothetical protein